MHDPGLALLRRYLPVLTVIAAPYAGVGGESDPLHPLDPIREWRALLRLLAATDALQSEVNTRLAFVRLIPPTIDELGAVLRACQPGDPDAFRVVHLIAHGEPDTLYLEDAHGGEAVVRDAQLVNLFHDSAAQIVILDGCFNHQLAHLLIAGTPIQAVIGTRRRVPEAEMIAFGAQFYRQITAGSSVRVAFQTALDHVNDLVTDHFELVETETLHQITLDMPTAALRAERPLVAPGMPRMIGVPQPVGFVGRRADLGVLADVLPGSTISALQGPTGSGKTWLAAAFVSRFGWRFDDGVLWFRCNAVTAMCEIVAAVARLLGLAAYAPAAEVQNLLRERHILIVLEDVDRMAIPAERERLIAWLRGINPDDGDRGTPNTVLLTGRKLDQVLGREQAALVQHIRPYTYKDARTLAMQVAIARGLDVLDVDTIDDFLDLTLYIPWLIMRGIDLIEAAGMDATFGTFATLTSESPDPVGEYLQRRVQRLAADHSRALTLVIRAQGLPDAFDAALAADLVGEEALEHIQTLLDHGVLWVEHDEDEPTQRRYSVPPPVREYLAEHNPLARAQQDFLDRTAMAYLARTWPDDVAALPFATLDHDQRARLNTIRTLIQRQLRPDIQLDLNVMAHVLSVTASTFRAAGLAEELVGYATGFREQIKEGVMLARLQIAMA
ncbi:MAG: ATP-binding protein, partial [Anaerolineae bacterium]|nr:ATP-binding protein [Anaerolineae bacterium]